MKKSSIRRRAKRYGVNWPAKPKLGTSEGWINMNEVSGFLLYSAYFAWKRKIESTLLPHDLTHVQFMLLMTLGFLKKRRRRCITKRPRQVFEF